MMSQHSRVESAQDLKPEDLNHVNILTVIFLPHKVLYVFSEVLYRKVLYTLQNDKQKLLVGGVHSNMKGNLPC